MHSIYSLHALGYIYGLLPYVGGCLKQ